MGSAVGGRRRGVTVRALGFHPVVTQLFGVKSAILGGGGGGVTCRFGGHGRALRTHRLLCGMEPGAVLVHQSPAWGAGHVPEPGAVGLCRAVPCWQCGLQLSAPGCNRRLLEGEGAESTNREGNGV